MSSDKRDEQVFAGVMLIGLAVLFLTHYWWPGILFVVGAAMIARTTAQGREWTSDRGALGVIAVGVVFAVFNLLGGFFSSSLFWPLVLIAVGLFLLFGRDGRWQEYVNRGPRRSDDTPKSKNDDLV